MSFLSSRCKREIEADFTFKNIILLRDYDDRDGAPFVSKNYKQSAKLVQTTHTEKFTFF